MEDIVKKFVEFYWDGADDSVKEYVKGTLSDFLNENHNEEDFSDIASDLADFLPPGQDPDKLPVAVQQLRSAMAVVATGTENKIRKEENDTIGGGITKHFIWLHQSKSVNPTIDSPSPATNLKEEESKDKKKEEVSTLVSSIKFSDLKVTAAEFKFNPPSFPTPTTEETLYNKKESEEYEEEEAYSYDDYDYTDAYNYNNEIKIDQNQPSLPLDRDAILAVLLQNFPEYSPTALEEMFISCGNSLPATIDVLYRLENELYGVQQQQQQRQQEQEKNSKSGSNGSSKNAGVEFSADDFPTLGGEEATGNRKTAMTTTSATSTLAFGANYAGRAKAAAHLPAPLPQKPTNTTTTANNFTTSSGPSSAAPVWQAQGIEKFSTGVSVAAEYAEARAEARDHARARNVCFEAATQAYIRGNKALAKELGAKGRWHNERMKAAHAVAAEETFTKRNAAVLAAASKNITAGSRASGAGGFGSSSSTDAAPPTIDLHGLHVSEALYHLDHAIENLQQKRVSKVRLVVGVGQHGKVPARLKAAVEKHLLEAWGLRCREPYEGLLEVNLLT